MRAHGWSAVLAATIGLGLSAAPALGAPTYSVGPISDVSSACAGQNAEVEQAVDARRGYVYEEWMGCGDGTAIGFARSTDGGRTFGAPLILPGSTGSREGTWDPSLAVAPDGTVYAGFMTGRDDKTYPLIAASFDHGASFTQSTALTPEQAHNWGDRDFVAVGPDSSVYVTWDYGPSAASITYICAPNGSCSFATGQLNAVMQVSHDHGRSFGAMSHISPGFPASGADSAPMVIEPNGRIDVLYQGYSYTDPATLTLGTALSYFTASSDGGRTWSAPVAVGAGVGSMNTSEWWIDGAIARDAGGTLYATWDTQATTPGGPPTDIGWLSYSTDGGRTWSAPTQGPSDRRDAAHIMEATGGAPGIAYVGWLSNATPAGYGQYLRTFSVAHGWLNAPTRISTAFGESGVWPGDTFGISTLSPDQIVLSWGSAIPGSAHRSEIFAARVGTAR